MSGRCCRAKYQNIVCMNRPSPECGLPTFVTTFDIIYACVMNQYVDITSTNICYYHSWINRKNQPFITMPTVDISSDALAAVLSICNQYFGIYFRILIRMIVCLCSEYIHQGVAQFFNLSFYIIVKTYLKDFVVNYEADASELTTKCVFCCLYHG